MTTVSPGAARPASSTADFSCADATGGSEHDGDRFACAGERQRQTAITRGQRARADPFQRLEHAPHRPLAQRSVAVEGGGDRTAGDSAEHQPATGAGIAEIKGAGGFGEASNADATHAPFSRAAAFDLRAQRSHRLSGIEHILAFEQTADAGLADRKRAEYQRAMRNRFVARHADTAFQRAGASGS